MLGNFACFLLSTDYVLLGFFFFQKNLFRISTEASGSNSLDPYQAMQFGGPNLGPKYKGTNVATRWKRKKNL